MTEKMIARWLCHRCARKEEIELEPDPVLLRVCEACQVENFTRLETVATVKVEEVPLEEPAGPESSPSEEELVIEAETVEEPVDPYKDLTKEQLVELLKEKAE